MGTAPVAGTIGTCTTCRQLTMWVDDGWTEGWMHELSPADPHPVRPGAAHVG